MGISGTQFLCFVVFRVLFFFFQSFPGLAWFRWLDCLLGRRSKKILALVCLSKRSWDLLCPGAGVYPECFMGKDPLYIYRPASKCWIFRKPTSHHLAAVVTKTARNPWSQGVLGNLQVT